MHTTHSFQIYSHHQGKPSAEGSAPPAAAATTGEEDSSSLDVEVSSFSFNELNKCDGVSNDLTWTAWLLDVNEAGTNALTSPAMEEAQRRDDSAVDETFIVGDTWEI